MNSKDRQALRERAHAAVAVATRLRERARETTARCVEDRLLREQLGPPDGAPHTRPLERA